MPSGDALPYLCAAPVLALLLWCAASFVYVRRLRRGRNVCLPRVKRPGWCHGRHDWGIW